MAVTSEFISVIGDRLRGSKSVEAQPKELSAKDTLLQMIAESGVTDFLLEMSQSSENRMLAVAVYVASYEDASKLGSLINAETLDDRTKKTTRLSISSHNAVPLAHAKISKDGTELRAVTVFSYRA